MNYIILQKDSIIIPIDVLTETAGEEIRSLKESGFTIVCDNFEATSTEQAIKKWGVKNNTAPVIEKTKKNEPESNYGIAQLVVKILSFIGWATVAIGVIFMFAGLGSMTGAPSFFQFVASVSPGFITAITGIFSVAAAQIVKATVDNADHSYQILKHLESK